MTNNVQDAVSNALTHVFSEIANGPASTGAFLLNRGDPGLLRSVQKLSAAEASAVPASGGGSVAAHVDHLCYGLELLVRWNRGEEPFEDANFGASWRRVSVSENDWVTLRERLSASIQEWHRALQQPASCTELALTEMIASVAHLGYHLGAIRQINRLIRGPAAND